MLDLFWTLLMRVLWAWSWSSRDFRRARALRKSIISRLHTRLNLKLHPTKFTKCRENSHKQIFWRLTARKLGASSRNAAKASRKSLWSTASEYIMKWQTYFEHCSNEVVVRMIMVFRLFLQGKSFTKAKKMQTSYTFKIASTKMKGKLAQAKLLKIDRTKAGSGVAKASRKSLWKHCVRIMKWQTYFEHCSNEVVVRMIMVFQWFCWDTPRFDFWQLMVAKQNQVSWKTSKGHKSIRGQCRVPLNVRRWISTGRSKPHCNTGKWPWRKEDSGCPLSKTLWPVPGPIWSICIMPVICRRCSSSRWPLILGKGP